MLTLTPRPPSGLQRADITQEVLVGPISANSTPGAATPADKSRKRTRTAAPTPSTLDEVDEITSTPRSARIARLFPGGSDAASKPLNVLIERLVEVSKATLIPKSKSTKSIKVDVDSAADILLLTGLIQEQASIAEARRVVFEPGRQTIPAPAPSSFAANAQFEFQSKSWTDKFDTLTNQVAKLVAVVSSNPQQPEPNGQAKSSYALAASKHAPGVAQAPQPPRPAQRSPPAQPKQNIRQRPETSLTLNQLDPMNIAGSGKSIPELIKDLNVILKTNNIKVSLDDTSPIVVRNIHRHPSGDLVLYLET
ncbi:hypothetical protein DFH28DRAFT_910391, partial [Melampsora americana]